MNPEEFERKWDELMAIANKPVPPVVEPVENKTEEEKQ